MRRLLCAKIPVVQDKFSRSPTSSLAWTTTVREVFSAILAEPCWRSITVTEINRRSADRGQGIRRVMPPRPFGA
jgi:hypothetical protein